MKYFLLYKDPIYTDAPILLNWWGEIDRKNIMIGRSHLLKDKKIIDVSSNEHMTFIDIISDPFLMLSRTCMNVIKMYAPYTLFKQIILLDSEHRSKEVYHLPILPHVSCLTEDSTWNMDKSILYKGVIDLSKVGDIGMFYLAETKNQYTVIRLDVLESMLNRGASGIAITQLETVKGAKKNE